MPLDPQVKEVLDQIAALGLPPHYEVGAVQARENAKLRPRVAGPDVAAVEDRTVPCPDGEVPVRIYWPDGNGPFPMLVWIHGGGMVVGTIETCDAACRRICLGAGCVVISPAYRLAPEDPFPAAPDDCFATVSWAADNAESLARRRLSPGRWRRERGRQPRGRRRDDGARPGRAVACTSVDYQPDARPRF